MTTKPTTPGGDDDWRAVARFLLAEDGPAAAADGGAAKFPAAGAAIPFGDYLLEEEIARGGMGIVYRAWHAPLGRAVAVKVMREGIFAGGREVERFYEEAAAAAALRHPGIVPVFATGECAGRLYHVMEWIGGPNLAEHTRGGPAECARAARWTREVAEAIAHAHAHGVTHRDLKPANVLLDEAERARVTDFGMARRADTAGGLTLSGQMLGTPGYMAPEMAGGDTRAAGTAVDIYGLGALLFHLLTGRAPFIGETHTAILRQLAEEEPVSPRLLNASVPRDLETVCLKALSREPGRRYATAAAMAEDLARFLHGEPVRARPVHGVERAWRWCRRKPALAASLAGVAALSAGMITVTAVSNRRIEGLRREAVERLYASDMRLALQNIFEGKYGAAVTLLEGHIPKAGEPDRRGFEWYCARELCRSGETAALESVDGVVRGIAWSADGHWVAAGADQWRLWEMTAGGAVLRGGGPGPVLSVAFSPDSRRLALSMAEGRLETREVASPSAPLMATRAHGDVAALAWSADGPGLEMVAGAEQLRWTPGGPPPAAVAALPAEARKPGVTASGRSASFVMRGQAGETPWRVAVWNMAAASLTANLPVGEDHVPRSFACSEDGRWLATGDYTGRLTLRKAPFTEVDWEETTHHGMVDQVAFSPDGTLLASAGDQVIQVRETATRLLRCTLRGHRRMILSLAFSPDGSRLVSGDNSGHLKLWTVPGPLTEAASPREGKQIKTSSDGGTLAWYSSPSEFSFQVWGSGVPPVVISSPGPDHTFFPLAGGLVTQPALGPAWAARIHQPGGPPGGVELPLPGGISACSPDGRWFACAAADTGVTTLVCREGKRPPQPLGAEKNAAHTVFSADSRLCAIGFRTGAVEIYNTETGATVRTLQAHRKWAYGKAFSRDGSLLATAGFDGAARIWDIASGRLIREFVSNTDTLWSVAISPDGARLAAGTGESTVILWDTANGLETGVLDLGLPRATVEMLAFTPDGEAMIAQMGHLLRAPRR